MTKSGPKPNRYDESIKEFFNSKTFKTMITVSLVAAGVLILCVCLYFLVILGGLGALLSFGS